MAHEVFIDTSGFYTLLVKGDDRHRQASDLMRDAAKKRLRVVICHFLKKTGDAIESFPLKTSSPSRRRFKIILPAREDQRSGMAF